MKCVVTAYFKDERGVWHQPGNAEEFSPEDYQRHAKYLKTIQTRIVEPPISRVVTPMRGRKRQ